MASLQLLCIFGQILLALFLAPASGIKPYYKVIGSQGNCEQRVIISGCSTSMLAAFTATGNQQDKYFEGLKDHQVGMFIITLLFKDGTSMMIELETNLYSHDQFKLNRLVLAMSIRSPMLSMNKSPEDLKEMTMRLEVKGRPMCLSSFQVHGASLELPKGDVALSLTSKHKVLTVYTPYQPHLAVCNDEKSLPRFHSLPGGPNYRYFLNALDAPGPNYCVSTWTKDFVRATLIHTPSLYHIQHVDNEVYNLPWNRWPLIKMTPYPYVPAVKVCFKLRKFDNIVAKPQSPVLDALGHVEKSPSAVLASDAPFFNEAPSSKNPNTPYCYNLEPHYLSAIASRRGLGYKEVGAVATNIDTLQTEWIKEVSYGGTVVVLDGLKTGARRIFQAHGSFTIVSTQQDRCRKVEVTTKTHVQGKIASGKFSDVGYICGNTWDLKAYGLTCGRVMIVVVG